MLYLIPFGYPLLVRDSTTDNPVHQSHTKVMTVNHITLPHHLLRAARMLALALLLVGLGTTTAQAQDDQEHKRIYNEARAAAEGKDYAKAYELYEEAAQLAGQAGDADVEDLSLKVLTQLDRIFATRALKNENYEEALQWAEAGIGHKEDDATHYYNKALALKNMEQIDDAMASFVKAIEVAEESGDRKIGNAARGSIQDYYTFLAGTALTRNGENVRSSDAQEALEHLAQLENYPVEPDADYYYYTAESQKVLGNLDASLTAAQQALELHRGSRSDKAKIYFVIGEVRMQQGDNEAAKEAFRNAAYGQYKAPAEHFLETLGR